MNNKKILRFMNRDKQWWMENEKDDNNLEIHIEIYNFINYTNIQYINI